MKEIRMEYSEYEAMVELIKEQQKAIEEFKKESRVVLIDERYSGYNSRIDWCNNGVPKIISIDAKLAKEYLKTEFDNLSKQFIEVKESLIRLEQENKPKERKNSSWWSF
jgi:hypothetical protein